MAHGLNPAQLDAVRTLSGPLLVLAGAGTGKTRVVTVRIAELIKSGVRPDRILAVTFTRKASGEMQERAAELLIKGKKFAKGGRGGRQKRLPKDAPRPEISTFHSLCVRVLRRHIAQLGYPERFTIADRGDQESEARSALREIKAPGEALGPSDLLAQISRWKMGSVLPSEAASIAESDQQHLAAVAYRRYQNNLKKAGVVDFDDLLLLTETLFKEHPTIRREEAGRFDHVLVDEYQDTNHSQYEIVRALAIGHRNLCVVGDDDQSIYAWRGAEVTHILGFHRDWPGAKVVRLEDNYRSRAPIINYANTLIAFNSVRHDKVLRPQREGDDTPRIMQCNDETEESKKVVSDIRFRLQQAGWFVGGPPEGQDNERPRLWPNDFAILFRTNEQPRAFEQELRAAKLPYVLIGGMSFYDRREVRDLLAYLKLVCNPDDEPALLRIMNTPPRGIGDGARKALVEHAVSQGKPLWRVLGDAPSIPNMSAAARQGVEKLTTAVESWRHLANLGEPVGALVRRVVGESRYHDELLRLYPDPKEREAREVALEEIVNAAAAYQDKKGAKASLQDFLDEVATGDRHDTDDKESQLGRGAIALMTLHAAKGLEFPHVYLVGMEEGILPHKRSLADGENAIAEERRLAYVGVTRARDRLTMSLALTRRKWGKPRDTVPSRFLYEMTGQADNPRYAAIKAGRAANTPNSGKKTARRR
ncbi:ATP-dependent DNA helicase PcrA [Pseudobythopirellula maris]|uniref:DNA 3'-5' helicase n=1 Tax=Pseudobythopirellula maris TaxID=2527991 RepID=A0A5C5ZUS6_9BACT|nr:UvrD-helicase domain-containing protein [Pseudobythopirellula maris]TWT90641.1 ATP-dependent DNA helicase PcrA [Pseudobythopirellula maris]